MVLVALVAVAMVTPGQIRLRRERRHLAQFGEFWLRGAAAHDKEKAVCLASVGRKPYEAEARQSDVSGHCYTMPRFADWSGEADWHGKEAAEYRAAAAGMASEEFAVRGRLIRPALFDIRRTAQ